MLRVDADVVGAGVIVPTDSIVGNLGGLDGGIIRRVGIRTGEDHGGPVGNGSVPQTPLHMPHDGDRGRVPRVQRSAAIHRSRHTHGWGSAPPA